MEKQPILKKVAFGGFDKKSVLDYIYELNNSSEEAQHKLSTQLEEITAAREKMAESLKEMEAKLDGAHKDREAVNQELTEERKRTGELGALMESLEQEINKQKQIVAEKDDEIAEHIRRNRELIDKNAELESKKDEVERASIYIGELLLRTRADSEKILEDASKQAEQMVAEAGRSMDHVYEQFQQFRTEMDTIQDQLKGSLESIQRKFSEMNVSVDQAEEAFQDFYNAPKGDPAIPHEVAAQDQATEDAATPEAVQDEQTQETPDPMQSHEGSDAFFRTAAGN